MALQLALSLQINRKFRHEGNGAGELQANQGGSQADCSGGTGTDCQRRKSETSVTAEIT